MKITDVEAIYVRLPQAKQQSDSGQDGLIVRVRTDEGITGFGEVDSAPLAVRGIINGPYSHTLCCGLKQLLLGEDPKRAKAFEPYDLFWLEEPLLPHNYEGYSQLSKSTHTRIAAGEEEASLENYRRRITEGHCDLVQVDLTRCGGFTGAMKIASLAHDHRRPIANDGFPTYINVAAALHWLNSIANALIVEFASQGGTGS